MPASISLIPAPGREGKGKNPIRSLRFPSRRREKPALQVYLKEKGEKRQTVLGKKSYNPTAPGKDRQLPDSPDSEGIKRRLSFNFAWRVMSGKRDAGVEKGELHFLRPPWPAKETTKNSRRKK